MSEPGRDPSTARPTHASVISVRDDLAVTQVAARRGMTPALSERVHEAIGASLPDASRLARTVSVVIVWAGPDQWLIIEPRRPDADRRAELAKAFKGLASVVDVSDARVIFDVRGAGVADALSRGIAIDLDPRVFKPGDVAITQAAHLGVLLWRADDGQSYCLACARTYAADFRRWLDATLASASPPAT